MIYGSNGAGKSTIIEAIVNTVTPEYSHMSFDFISDNRTNGSTTITVEQTEITCEFRPDNQIDSQDPKLILLDAPFRTVNDDRISQLLTRLRDIYYTNNSHNDNQSTYRLRR
ncbi:MAG: AAA family ATPase [Halobacteriaceae archaeon]